MVSTDRSSMPDPNDPEVLGANPLVGMSRQQVLAALMRVAQHAVVEPGVVVAQMTKAAGDLIDVAIGRSDVTPERGDKRFTHAAWQKNPVYKRLLQSYLVERKAVLGLVDEFELDAKSRERAHFALSLFTEAVAPTNTLLGNPSALAKAVETRGKSLVDGVRHMAHDVRHNNGMPSMVDTRPFEVGGNLAVTPGQVVYRSEVIELIQYTPTTEKVHQRPLVAIPPQINKYYISDLAPGKSLIEYMVSQDITYFTISWRNPTPVQHAWDLDTYVTACIEALEVAAEITGVKKVNVLGMCAGAITMSCMLGHLAATGKDIVNSITYLVAGLDTEQETQVGALASRPALEAARSRSQKHGVLDGSDLSKVFAWLRPNDLVWNYWVNNYLMGQNPPAFDILFWNADTTSLPAALHSDFLDLQAENGLKYGTTEVLGTKVDLATVTHDAYVVAGRTDHIVPWTMAYQTTQLLGGDSTFVLGASGHIQAIVNPPSSPKASFHVRSDGKNPPTAKEWLAEAEQIDASWWTHWAEWLSKRSGRKVNAREDQGSEAHPPLEPAPGRYVHL